MSSGYASPKRGVVIGVNGRPALWEHSGVGRVVLNLIRRLAAGLPDWTFIVYCDRTPRPDHPLASLLKTTQNCRLRSLRSGSSVAFELLHLPHALQADDVDAFLATIPETRIPDTVPTVLIVYDAVPELYPRTAPFRLRVVRLSGLVRRNVRRARRVVCPSQNTARDIGRIFGVPARKVQVAPLGVDPAIRALSPSAAHEQLSKRFSLAPGFLFTLKVAQPGAFFHTYARYRQSVAQPLPLVMAGTGRPVLNRSSGRCSEFENSSIRVLGRVSDVDLSALYSGCSAFIYPSLYEGFGLPLLEALSCGALCIAYNTSSLPEVLGDAGVLVEPWDEAGLLDAMRRATEGPGLADAYRPAIQARQGTFDWQPSVSAVRTALEHLVE